MLRLRLLSLRPLLLALAVLFAACSSPVEEEASAPNILFVISDDQSYPHTSAYGSFVSTPAFDRVAENGVLFQHAFVPAPSCAPARSAILSGRPFYRTSWASMNHRFWPEGVQSFVDVLAGAGYHTGYTGKGWAPGNWKWAGRSANPAGPEYQVREGNKKDYAAAFHQFLAAAPPDTPFCFWFGAHEPHRPLPGRTDWTEAELARAEVPAFLPDSPEVRRDMLDYAAEIERFDRHLGLMLEELEAAGRLHNTLVVVTSDNGMAFPRAKTTVYDSGVRVPLAVQWPARIQPRRVVEDFVNIIDFAPTVIEAAGLQPPGGMIARSLLDVLLAEGSGQIDPSRDHVIVGLERHGGIRTGYPDYPMRAIRTKDYLYIRNAHPDHYPAGPPECAVWPADDPTGGYGATDGSPSKTFLVTQRRRHPDLFSRAFDKRPAEELYDLRTDPEQTANVADTPEYESIRAALAARLAEELKRTEDPRALGQGDVFERYRTQPPPGFVE